MRCASATIVITITAATRITTTPRTIPTIQPVDEAISMSATLERSLPLFPESRRATPTQLVATIASGQDRVQPRPSSSGLRTCASPCPRCLACKARVETCVPRDCLVLATGLAGRLYLGFGVADDAVVAL